MVVWVLIVGLLSLAFVVLICLVFCVWLVSCGLLYAFGLECIAFCFWVLQLRFLLLCLDGFALLAVGCNMFTDCGFGVCFWLVLPVVLGCMLTCY